MTEIVIYFSNWKIALSKSININQYYIFNKNVVLGEARSIAHQVILVIRSRVLPVVDFTTPPTRLH